MDLILKNVIILDKNSQFHNQKTDVFITNGIIKDIGKFKIPDDVFVTDLKGAYISPGWFDIGTRLTEPGFESFDDINTLSASAKQGGFTGLAVFPNTNPVIDNSSMITMVLTKSKDSAVSFYPVGALTKSNNGLEISEMYDMFNCGAIAFSDGKIPVAHAGVLSRALKYSSQLGTRIVNHPEDYTISESGVINESNISVELGLKGRPALAEKIMLIRDIHLAEYNDTPLVTHMISTSESVSVLKNAKKNKVQVFATVSYHNLVADETLLRSFDSNHKVMPPLRGKKDIDSLIKGLKDDTIDAIVSNHYPLDVEDKKKAFFDAKYGALGLESMFGLLYKKIGELLGKEKLIDKISNGPRRVLGLDEVKIEKDEPANFTIFNFDDEYVFTDSMIKSKSSNSPFIGKTLQGKVLGIYNNGLLHINN